MSQPPLNNPGARYWDDLVEEFNFSAEEKQEIRSGADRMIAEVRARRLADVGSARMQLRWRSPLPWE
jgi:hypothetical protein